MRTNLAKLVNIGKPAEYDPIADMYVASQLRIIGENRIVPDLAVMCQVHVCHDPIIIAQTRYSNVLGGPDVECAEFANRISIADFQTCRLASVFFILRSSTNRRKLKKDI